LERLEHVPGDRLALAIRVGRQDQLVGALHGLRDLDKYLGSDYEVLASFGHIRDLPAKDGSVDPEQDFHLLARP
jgi:hypothetical protein